MRKKWMGLRLWVSVSLVASLVPNVGLAEELGTTSPIAPDAMEASDVGEGEANSQEMDQPSTEMPQTTEDVPDALPETANTLPEETLGGESEDDAVTQDVFELGVGDVEVSAGEGQEWMGSFVAPKPGTYVFASNDAHNAVGTLIADDGSSEQQFNSADEDGDGFSLSLTLAQGEKAMLHMHDADGAALSCTLSVGEATESQANESEEKDTEEPFESADVEAKTDAQLPDAAEEAESTDDAQILTTQGASTAVTIGMGSTTASAEDGEEWYGRFTAPESTTYTFYSSGDAYDTYGILYESDGETEITSNDDDGIDSNFSITCTLDKGQTVILGVREYNYERFECSITVKSLEIPDLSLGENAVHASSAGEQWIGKFIAPKAATYVFYSSGDMDTYGYLYEGIDTGRLASDDDSGAGSNFRIEYELEAGQVVYLRAMAYDSDDVLSCTISVYEDNEHDLGIYGYARLSSDGAMSYGGNTWWFSGEPIAPAVSVYFTPKGESSAIELEEGTDYTVTYENNDRPSTDDAPALARITGTGDYVGTITSEFKIVDSLSFGEHHEQEGMQVVLGGEGTYYSYYGDNAVQYVATGWPIQPTVQFNYYAYEPYAQYTPIEGEDFTVSYTDANGVTVTEPTDEGDYKIVLTAIDGGKCSGTYEVPFTIVAKQDLSKMYQHSWSFTPDYDGAITGSGYSFYIDDVVDDADKVQSMEWDWMLAGKQMIRDIDYTLSVVFDAAKSVFSYLFTGMGNYTGSVSTYVYTAKSAQAAFDRRTVYINGESYLAYSRVSTSKPIITFGDLVEGRDYQYDGLVDENGNKITSANVGDTVYVHLVGIGQYAGCERSIRIVFGDAVETTDIGLQSGIEILNGEATSWPDNRSYLLRSKSATPSVAVCVYRTHELNNVVLTNEDGLKVSTKLSSDGKTMDVTATPDTGLPFTGSKTLTVDLVDKYDVKTLRPNERITVTGANGEIGRCSVSAPSTMALKCNGTAFVPKVQYTSYKSTTPTYSTSLRNSKGTTVQQITGAGDYTLVLTFNGDWTGVVEIPLKVSSTTAKIDVANCNLTLGAATLTNGAARPTVTLSTGNTTYVQGTDYTVAYGDNTTVGKKGWVTVTATKAGKLAGSTTRKFMVGEAAKEKNFEAGGFELQLQNASGEYVSADSNYKVRTYKLSDSMAGPAVRVVKASATDEVLDASNYTVEYGNNSANGVSYVAVTGKGDYKGTLKANYYAYRTGVTSIASAQFSVPSQAYTGKAVTPKPTVSLNGTTLTLNTDYTLAYENNTKAGTARITVTGKGSYGGFATREFSIVNYSKTGWVTLTTGRKGYVKNGKLVSGWMDLGTSKYYFRESDNSLVLGWYTLGTMRYYFNPSSGNLARGTWMTIDGQKYYFRPSGNMATGFADIDDNGVTKKYYFDEYGQMVTGWQDIEVNGKEMHYYFRPAGSMAIGWADIYGTKYYFRASGNMATGWADINGSKFYFDDYGCMQVGWQEINDKTYYFRASGAMQTGKATIDGVTYTFSASGVLQV